MLNYLDLLKILNQSSDSSGDELIFLSKSLAASRYFLDEVEIVYEEQAEGIKIDFSAQKFKIYKTKKDCINRLSIDDFERDILIIEDSLIFISSGEYFPIFFENVLFWHKFVDIFRRNEIFHYDDFLHKKFIFLSEKHGKVEVGYEVRDIADYYDANNNVKNAFELISARISNNQEFKTFIRDSFIGVSKEIASVKSRFTESLISINKILESASRDFELFKNKFSFEEFRNSLEKDKEKYFKEYQGNLSDFLSKIASMPIQFGVYLYLILRFQNDFIPLFAVTILIFSWSIFSCKSIGHIIFNIDYLVEKFNKNFDEIVKKSGMTKEESDINKSEVKIQFKKVIGLVKAYRIVIIIFTICSILFCIHLLSDSQELKDLFHGFSSYFLKQLNK